MVGRDPVAVLASILGLIAAIVLVAWVVVIPGPEWCTATGRVCVTEITWDAALVESNGTPDHQCLTGLPASTPGRDVATASSMDAAILLTVNPEYAASCYVLSIGVETPGFFYGQPHNAWFQASSGFALNITISTPPSGFGPAPVTIILYTSTVPGCLYCP